jgi:hypothetical protein
MAGMEERWQNGTMTIICHRKPAGLIHITFQEKVGGAFRRLPEQFFFKLKIHQCQRLNFQSNCCEFTPRSRKHTAPRQKMFSYFDFVTNNGSAAANRYVRKLQVQPGSNLDKCVLVDHGSRPAGSVPAVRCAGDRQARLQSSISTEAKT